MGHFRESGNAFYATGDINKAIDVYTEGIIHDPNDAVLLLSNRAACFLILNNPTAAALDCQRALLLDPLNSKVYYRLAKSISQSDEKNAAIDAASYICISVGLYQARSVSTDLYDLYRKLRIHDWMPENVSKGLACVGSSQALAIAVKSRKDVVVLKPGIYDSFAFTLRQNKSCTLIGIGDVELNCTFSHAVYVSNPDEKITLINIRLVGSGLVATATVANNASISFIRCRVESYSDAAFLAVDGTIELDRCVIRETEKQAIEIRQNGIVKAVDVTIENCYQGIIAYGGARSLFLQNSRIVGSKKEGIMLAGTFENAATAMQPKAFRKSSGQKVSKIAEMWGKEHGIQLDVSIINCDISNSGSFGISVDYGASVIITQTHFKSNDCCAVYIKGGSNASITACQFIYSGAKSKYVHGFARFDQAGVYTAINYGGTVSVSNNAFLGPEDLAVVEERKHNEMMKRSFPTLWSKPVIAKCNQHFNSSKTNENEIPDIRTLSHKINFPIDGDISTLKKEIPRISDGNLRPICRVVYKNPWAPSAAEFYAIGNTFGYDVIGQKGKFDNSNRVRVLLAASGDIRNLIATVHAHHDDNQISFTLNDGNKSILARNAVLLYLTAELHSPPEVVLAVWSDQVLTISHKNILSQALENLANDEWPSWLSASYSLDAQEDDAETEFRSIFRAWLTCTMSGGDLLSQREAIISSPGCRKSAQKYSIDAISSLVAKSNSKKFAREIISYIDNAYLTPSQDPRIIANPTFLLAPELQYTVYFSSSIYRAIQITDTRKTLYASLLATISLQLKSVADAFHRGALNCLLVPGDVLGIMTAPKKCNDTLELSHNYDFIDCSNVADFVSIPALVQASKLILSTSPHACLQFESITLIRHAKSNNPDINPKSFVESQVGNMALSTYENLVGICLVDTTSVPGYDNAIRFAWMQKERCIPNAAELLLELILPCRNFLDISKAEYTQRASALGGPMALVHLLSLSIPSESNEFLSILLCCCGFPCELYMLEISTHALVQAHAELSLVKVTYRVEPGINMLLYTVADAFLVLSLSSLPLEQGKIDLQNVQQLISSFSWDEEMATATFLISNNNLEKYSTSFVNLSASLNGSEFNVIGKSKQLIKLSRDSCSPYPWRSDKKLIEYEFDMEIIWAAACNANGEYHGDEWKSTIQTFGSELKICAVAPKPIPATDQAKVTTSVLNDEFIIRIQPKEMKHAYFEQYAVKLPLSVLDEKVQGVKMMRRIGLLSATLKISM